MPAYMASVSRLPTAKLRLENRSSFSIGSAARALVGQEQGEGDDARRRAGWRSRGCSSRSGAARSARTRCRRGRAHQSPAPMTVDAPTGDRRRRGARRRGPAAIVAITTGTFSAKIQRHESCVDDPASRERPDDRRDPAPGGPRSDRRTTLLRAERRDDDRERRRRQQRRRRALEARAAIRTSIVGANAQATEKTPKPARPSVKIRRSP